MCEKPEQFNKSHAISPSVPCPPGMVFTTEGAFLHGEKMWQKK
jgi:hypothetical protein